MSGETTTAPWTLWVFAFSVLILARLLLDLIGWLIGRYVRRWIDRHLDHAVNMAIIAWIANNYQPKDTFDDHT
jgi:hypothetical protein